MTQNEMVLGWLKKAPIGPFEAMKELGIMRLAARVKDLRDDGHKIQTDWNYVIDRYGEERRVARYVLKELANGKTDILLDVKRVGGEAQQGRSEKSFLAKLRVSIGLFGGRYFGSSKAL